MDIQLIIDTIDRKFAGELLEETREPVPLTDGVTLRYESSELREAVGAPEITHFLLQIAEELSNDAKAVALGLVSAWLYKRLEGRQARLRTTEGMWRLTWRESSKRSPCTSG